MAANAQKVRDDIHTAIQGDATIKDKSHVSVTVVNVGLPVLGKKQIQLTGRVARDDEKTKILDLARSAAKGLEVVDKIRVVKG